MARRRDYGRRLRRAIRQIADEEGAHRIVLWQFPEADFARWCQLVGDPEAQTYAQYLAMLSAVERDQRRAGRHVIRARFSVARMIAELEARGWPNDPPHRSSITGLLAEEEDLHD